MTDNLTPDPAKTCPTQITDENELSEFLYICRAERKFIENRGKFGRFDC